MNLKQKAIIARAHFHQIQDQKQHTIWVAKDSAPEWVTELSHEAHGEGMLPDDHCYQFLVDALDLLAEHDDLDEASSHVEADIYTKDLLEWLASDLGRLELCDEAASEYGESETTLDRISKGQLYERSQILQRVADFLENSDEKELEAA